MKLFKNLIIVLLFLCFKSYGQNIHIKEYNKIKNEYNYTNKLKFIFHNIDENLVLYIDDILIAEQPVSELFEEEIDSVYIPVLEFGKILEFKNKKHTINPVSVYKIEFKKSNKITTIKYLKEDNNKKIDNNPPPADEKLIDINPGLSSENISKFETRTTILNDAKILINEDEALNDEKIVILKRYNILPRYDSISKNNVFLKKIKFGDIIKSSGLSEGKTNIAKTDVTNFATGMARFLADRAKQELNESFFIQMHKQMEKVPELQAYFPESYKYLKRFNSSFISFDLEYLKNRFETDIKFLPQNILHTISIADNSNYPHFKNVNHYLNNNVNGIWINIALHSVLESNGNINPKDLLYNFVHTKNTNNVSMLSNLESKLKSFDDKSQINLINSIKLAELVSNSLLSPETGKYWVSENEIQDLVKNDQLFQTYIGLLLAKSEFEEYKIKFNNTDLKHIVENNFAPNGNISDLKNLKNLITEIYHTYQAVEGKINDIKKTENNTELADKSYEAFNLVKTSVFTIQKSISKNKYLGNDNININTDVFSNYIDPSVEVAYNLFNKKYNLAIKNFVFILNQVPSVSKFMSDYDLVNLLESTNFDETKQLNGHELITTFIKQKDVRKSLIESKTFNEEQIDNLIKNDSINKTDLLNLVKSKEKEINTFLKDNKDVKVYFENQSKDYNNFISKLTTYGTLIANVSEAQNSDQVKAAIEAAVLPVGSSRIKRYSDFSVMVNAYVGGFYGQAYYKVEGEKKSISTFGVTAPIGVTVAWGKMNFLGKNNALSLNLQIIDLGSLVNFYYQKGDGAQLPPDTKVQLGDILAPGASISYSLFNSPFSIFAGAQYVPNLSRMEAISTNTELKPLTWRWHAGIAIDIPLLSLWVKN